MAAPASNSFDFEDHRHPLVEEFHPSKWCHSLGKRAFDACVSLFLLLCAAPLFPIIAILIKLSSSGPILFVHERVGRDGKTFRMLKFRTMTHVKSGKFTVLTRTGDQRVTELGWHLRRWKLDELPQLFNVLRGDMSFIGPRPHMRPLLGNGPELRYFLSLRPGITGLATMLFRHEETALPRLNGEDLESFYIANVLPEKIYMELQYAENASLATDLLIIMRTMQQIFSRKKNEAVLRTSQSILARHSRISRSVLAFPRRLRRPLMWSSCLVLVGVFFLSAERLSDSPHAWTTRLETKALESKAGSAFVWADVSSGRYYCYGSAFYGKTPKGEYLREQDARAEHLAPERSTCSPSAALTVAGTSRRN
jgi:lipopolysaccharide/colanic/teichoic acid biosynthesis glycosyltransferase